MKVTDSYFMYRKDEDRDCHSLEGISHFDWQQFRATTTHNSLDCSNNTNGGILNTKDEYRQYFNINYCAKVQQENSVSNHHVSKAWISAPIKKDDI